MIKSPQPNGATMAKGAFLMFLAGSLLFPSGFVTAVYLSRTLGPVDYGLFAILTRLVIWLEGIGTTIFHDVSMQFVGEDVANPAIQRLILRIHLISGCLIGGGLYVCSGLICDLFNEPSLETYLKIFSIEIPLFCIASANKVILTGKGLFSQVAGISAFKIIARLFLIIFFVQSGLSLTGAIMGIIGTTMIEMLLSSLYLRPSFFGPVQVSAKRLVDFGGPLIISKGALNIFLLDLFALKILGGSAAQAGFYGAALNLAIVPNLFAMALTRTLHSTLCRLKSNGETVKADQIAVTAIRSVFIIFPFAVMTVGVSSEIVVFVFGQAFAATGPILSLRIFVPVFLLMIAIADIIMITNGKPALCMVMSLPMLLLAVAGHMIFTPRFGGVGAAGVTASISCIGGLTALILVNRIFAISPPWKTVLRSGLCSAVVYVSTAIWTVTGWLVFIKIIVVSMIIILVFLIAGEFSRNDLVFLKQVFKKNQAPVVMSKDLF